MKKLTILKSTLILSLLIFCLAIIATRSAQAGWRGETRVNVDNFGKQASRGSDCPWSISVDNNDRVHVVWEDRRQGYPLRIYYRGKNADPTWSKWDGLDYELSTIDSVVKFGHPSIAPQRNGKLFSVYVEERAFNGELFGSWVSDHPSGPIESEMVSGEGGNHLTFSSSGWQTTIAVYENRSITFWPYVDPDRTDILPIYFRIYENDLPVSSEKPIILPEREMDYWGVHLSACAGSNNKIYLACRLTTEDFPAGHIFIITIDIKTEAIIEIEDITPDETLSCSFPYIAARPMLDGNDIIYVVYEKDNTGGRAIFATNRSGQWSDKIALAPAGETSGRPCLAVNGDFVDIVYESPNNTFNSQIFHQRYYSNTGELAEPVRITSTEDFFNKRPVIASDSYGNIHVIYITNRENPDRFADEEVYYSVYDAPPSAPKGLKLHGNGNLLRWRANREPDISHYEIELLGENLIVYNNEFEIEGSIFEDELIIVRAVDLMGQKSEPAILRLADNGVWNNGPIPASFAIGRNYPNPFNNSTVIPISSKAAAPAYLEILDITGRIVNVISIRENDANEVIWNGTDAYGENVSSGTYFYRLETALGAGQARKMSLLR